MSKPTRIIGIAGTNGSGKDTLGELLASDFDWLFISVTDLLRAEAKKRGLPTERQYTSQISAEWRRESGLGVLIDKAVEQYEKQNQEYKGLVISSLRNPGEVDEVHVLGGEVVWIDADPKLRYQRATSRGRGSEDNKTFKQFMTEEAEEMNQGGDSATLNMAGVKQKCDIFIINNGDDLTDFKSLIKQELKL